MSTYGFLGVLAQKCMPASAFKAIPDDPYPISMKSYSTGPRLILERAIATFAFVHHLQAWNPAYCLARLGLKGQKRNFECCRNALREGHCRSLRGAVLHEPCFSSQSASSGIRGRGEESVNGKTLWIDFWSGENHPPGRTCRSVEARKRLIAKQESAKEHSADQSLSGRTRIF